MKYKKEVFSDAAPGSVMVSRHLLMLLTALAATTASATPAVIAHRGASGYSSGIAGRQSSATIPIRSNGIGRKPMAQAGESARSR